MARPPNPPSVSPTDPTRILVVDDDESMRSALVRLLEQHGYAADSAEDGLTALRAAGEKQTTGLGEFSGELTVEETGSCSIEATVGDRQVSGAVAVAERPMRGAESTIAALSRRIAAAGGSIGSADDVSSVVRAIESSPETMSPVVTVHPMRAWWWMIPFAGCLSIEWWLRRRGGLR